eukprot:GHVT01035569.1.p1 GENE.GHVT01035569.1~~GHVT01035569.1.p1  ORF type:complete len:504 (+),score=80.80 GHVT01035569.1:340-1851(+)
MGPSDQDQLAGRHRQNSSRHRDRSKEFGGRTCEPERGRDQLRGRQDRDRDVERIRYRGDDRMHERKRDQRADDHPFDVRASRTKSSRGEADHDVDSDRYGDRGDRDWQRGGREDPRHSRSSARRASPPSAPPISYRSEDGVGGASSHPTNRSSSPVNRSHKSPPRPRRSPDRRREASPVRSHRRRWDASPCKISHSRRPHKSRGSSRARSDSSSSSSPSRHRSSRRRRPPPIFEIGDDAIKCVDAAAADGIPAENAGSGDKRIKRRKEDNIVDARIQEEVEKRVKQMISSKEFQATIEERLAAERQRLEETMRQEVAEEKKRIIAEFRRQEEDEKRSKKQLEDILVENERRVREEQQRVAEVQQERDEERLLELQKMQVAREEDRRNKIRQDPGNANHSSLLPTAVNLASYRHLAASSGGLGTEAVPATPVSAHATEIRSNDYVATAEQQERNNTEGSSMFEHGRNSPKAAQMLLRNSVDDDKKRKLSFRFKSANSNPLDFLK